MAVRYLQSDRLIEDMLAWGAVPLLWTWLTFGSLSIFWLSMRRARVRRIHMLRCVLYGLDPAFWAFLSFVALVPPIVAIFALPEIAHYLEEIDVGFLLIAIGAGVVRLYAGLKHYMRFDHCIAVVLATQVMVALVMANAALLYILRF